MMVNFMTVNFIYRHKTPILFQFEYYQTLKFTYPFFIYENEFFMFYNVTLMNESSIMSDLILWWERNNF